MILGAEWVFPVTAPPLFRHAVEVEGNTIRGIRPLREDEPFLARTCILPGLVNAHTHLAYTALRNRFDDLDFFSWIRKLTETKYRQMTEADLMVSTQLGIVECLRAGITTVADMSDCEPSLKMLSRSPLRGNFYWEVFGVEREQADRSWQDLLRTHPRLKGEYEREGLKIGVSPHSCYTVRPELYRSIAVWAGEHGIPVSFHLAESKEEEEFIRTRSGVIQKFLEKRASDWQIMGSSSMSHLESTGIFETRPLVAHLVQAGERDLDMLSNRDVAIAHCPKSNAKFGHGIAPVFEFEKRRFRIGLGTDSAASNNRLDLFEEARFALLQQRSREKSFVFSEHRMLELMTIEGARAMQMDDQIGSLDSGKQADMIAVRIPPYYSSANQVLFHLIHNTTAGDVCRTIIAGKEVNPVDMEEDAKELYRK